MSLIDGDKDQHTLTCYRVCVFMKAAGFLYRLPKKDRKASLRRHLERSKKQYEHEIHKGLSEIDCLAPPSLVLLQAFLSGVGWTAFLSLNYIEVLIYSLSGTVHAKPR